MHHLITYTYDVVLTQFIEDKKTNLKTYSQKLYAPFNVILTQFIEDEGIGLDALAELVGFAADHDGDVARACDHGDERTADPRHDEAVRQQGMRSQEHFGRLEQNGLFNDALNTFYLRLYGKGPLR